MRVSWQGKLLGLRQKLPTRACQQHHNVASLLDRQGILPLQNGRSGRVEFLRRGHLCAGYVSRQAPFTVIAVDEKIGRGENRGRLGCYHPGGSNALSSLSRYGVFAVLGLPEHFSFA